MRSRSSVLRNGAASEEFAALLKQYRVLAGLSQQALADRARISVQAVSALERGYRKVPYQDTLDRLASALNLTEDARADFAAAAQRARASRSLERETAYGHNLRRALTSFVGRDRVVSEITALVDASPLVSVVGAGGAGKTRVAVEVASQMLHRFRGGVWFVELAPLSDAALVPNAIAAALHVEESPRRSLLASLAAAIGAKELLLVVDNCEHVIEDARATVGSLIRECPNLKALVTSREPLAIAGERVYRIPSLSVPPANAVAAGAALDFGAVALFVDRARAADSRFALTKENVADVVEICRRLDGLPLALELAAARASMLSPRQIAERLDRVFDILTAPGGASVPRHRTMRAVVDWSYELLSPRAQLLFERLGAFAGTLSLDAAVAVCTDERLPEVEMLDLLGSLAARSLLTVDFAGGAARYRLIEAIRQYARERLERDGQREAVAARHALAYRAIAERRDAEWYEAPERAWFEEAEADLGDCRAALVWTLSEGHDVTAGCAIAAALARVWYSFSPVEGRRWVRSALAALQNGAAGGSGDRTLLARLYLTDSELCGALGEYKAALAGAQRALAATEDSCERVLAVRAQLAAGTALGALGQMTAAEELLQRALDGARELGNRRLQALALGDLGTMRSRGGDIALARRYYADALATYESLGLQRPAASIAGHLAEVEFAAGDAVAAVRRASEARAGHEATQNHRSVANDLSNIAAYLVALQRYDEARVHAVRALTIAREFQATVLSAYVLQHLAAIGALRESAVRRGSDSDRERAAQLLGFIDARLASLEASREYTERQEYERMQTSLRAMFGDERLRALMASGAAWSEDAAARVALDL